MLARFFSAFSRDKKFLHLIDALSCFKNTADESASLARK
jgi:hypothetical protein